MTALVAHQVLFVTNTDTNALGKATNTLTHDVYLQLYSKVSK